MVKGAMNTVLGAGMVVLVSGCMNMGPKRMQEDRRLYAGAAAESWKYQALQNIVKLRYTDWPSFIEISQIATSYTFEQTGSAKATLRQPFRGDNDQLEAGWVGKMSERPTVLYKPLTGEKFVNSMLTPIPPAAVLGLIQSGWAADQMFAMLVSSVNGINNVDLRYGEMSRAETGYADLLRLLSELQKQKALVVEIRQEKLDEKNVKSYAIIGFRKAMLDDETREELAAVQKVLGLDPLLDRYRVVWDVAIKDPDKLSIQTRSILQVMVALSMYIDVPQSDIDEGRVVMMKPVPKTDDTGLPELISIKSGEKQPPDAYVAIEYRDRWFWIEDTDVWSKRTFAYLSLLLTVSESDSKSGAQLVITTN